MTARTALFILGMHRSGTSALARVVSLLGAGLPKRVLPAGLGNELGHWEPEAAVALHDKLLKAAGTSVNGLSGPPDAWFESAAAQAFVEPMRELIETEFADASLFVFKDPRSALVFPLWRRVLAELGIRCAPVVMLRDPAEVAASLATRQSKAVPWQTWTLDRGGLLWLRYSLAAERHTRGQTRAFCTYASLLNDWQATARHVADKLDITWPRSHEQAAPKINAFLDASHHHQRSGKVPAGSGVIWSSWIDPAAHALCDAAIQGEAKAQVLDTIERSFSDVCASMQPLARIETAPVAGPTVPSKFAQAVAGQRRLCIVVTASMLQTAQLRDLSRLLDDVSAHDISITLVPSGELSPAASDVLTDLAAKHRLACSEPSAVAIEPAFLKPTVELFRHLRSQSFDVILFPDRGGPGYASLIAKGAGLAFAGTTLGVIAYGTARWERERERRFPSDLVTLSVEYIEQKAIGSADIVLLPSQDVAQFMQNAGWHWQGAQACVPSGEQVATALQASLRSAPARRIDPDSPGTPVADSITVVISHFERPQLLTQNLEALEQQTDCDFSVIVVDDGSRSTQAQQFLDQLEERYRHLGLRLIRQTNRYLGAARNTGIRAATSDFVILLDDDNIAFPHLVATLRRAVRATRADVITCGIRHFHSATGTPTDDRASGPDQVFAGGPLLVGAVHNCFGDASGIYRRAVFEEVGYFHELYGVTFEDWEMHLRVAAAGLRLVSLPEVLVWYRVRPDSMLRTTHPHDNARVIASVIRELPGAALDPLADFLIGQEQERVRLNFIIEATRAVAAVQAANLAENDSSQHALGLEQMLQARTQDARAAEQYAQSLERALSEAHTARDASAEYARTLEAARSVAETYAKDLETELTRLRAEAVPPQDTPPNTEMSRSLQEIPSQCPPAP